MRHARVFALTGLAFAAATVAAWANQAAEPAPAADTTVVAVPDNAPVETAPLDVDLSKTHWGDAEAGAAAAATCAACHGVDCNPIDPMYPRLAGQGEKFIAQQLVYFEVAPERCLVDLPGYGYAKVPLELKAHWEKFLDRWFQTRQALRGLVVVMDIRHPLKDYDRQMIGYAVARGLPAHALLTKADKLGRGQQAQALAAVRRELAAAWGADTVSVQTFSSESKQGVDEARAIVTGWLEL